MIRFFLLLALIPLPHGRGSESAGTALGSELHTKGWIVFAAQTEKGDWDLFLMRPDGSQRRNITNTPGSNEIGGRFSPDGKRILFRRIPLEVKLNHNSWGQYGKLVIANRDGSHDVEQGDFPWASWSPDGKQVSTLTKTGIELYDLATKQLVRKLDRQGIYQQLYWSPDGKHFTGPANIAGENWTVVRLNAATGELNPVNKYQNCTPDWFPDSKRIIFSSRPAGQATKYGWTQLWMADGDGSNKRLLVREDGKHIYGGAVSPDGRYVIYTRSDVDGMSKSPMAILRLSDNVVHNLTDGFEPHWTQAK